MIKGGERIGRLIVVERAGRANDGHVLWLCVCDCGSRVVRQSNNLQTKRTMQSCGCANSDLQKTHGMSGTETYGSWQSAKRRCHSADDKDFYRYGALGISMCEEWRESFEAFLRDMGERPPGTTLDRWPDKRGNYTPGNCRWATASEQQRNRRNAVYVRWSGKDMHINDIATALGISRGAAFMRYKRGKLHDHHV